MGTTVVFGMFVFLTNRKYRIGIVSSKSAETANVSVLACSKKYGDLIKKYVPMKSASGIRNLAKRCWKFNSVCISKCLELASPIGHFFIQFVTQKGNKFPTILH